MTNLEWLKNKAEEFNLPNSTSIGICILCYKLKNQGNGCGLRKCNYCEFNDIEKCFDYLMQEHKEPIKLKKWEYDTIKHHGKLSKFNDIHFLMAMKNKGYFKDMNSVEKCSMTIKEILDNCEVEDD